MEDRRKSVRVRVNFVASLRARNSLLAGSSLTKDISETGVCVPSKLHFPVGFLLELNIRSQLLKKSIKTMVKVVRVVASKDINYPFELGTVFLNIPPNAQMVIRDYIQGFLARGDGQGFYLND